MENIYVKFWDNAESKTGKYTAFDANNKNICDDDIKESIRHAFRDLTVRTMTRKTKKSICLDDLAKESYDTLIPLFNEWFNKDPKKGFYKDIFDTWHENACNQVIAFLKKYYIEDDCTYGKAQKIINMSFKNLYALCAKKGIETVSEYFKYCHVPLDSFTLEWFQRECQKKGCKIIKGHISKWSVIREYKSNDNEYKYNSKSYYTYFFFQEKFRKFYPSGKLTPLQSEFENWLIIQKELAAEGFLFALVEDISPEDKENIKGMSLEEKINEIKKHIL